MMDRNVNATDHKEKYNTFKGKHKDAQIYIIRYKETKKNIIDL